MKRYIALVTSLLLFALIIFSFSSCATVEIGQGEIVAVFKYGDADITQTLSDEDSKTVKDIFKGKNLLKVKSHTVHYGHIVSPRIGILSCQAVFLQPSLDRSLPAEKRRSLRYWRIVFLPGGFIHSFQKGSRAVYGVAVLPLGASV